ncbi:MAG: cobalt ECF transporter T component CbiQ [Flavonifractor plautii]
MINSYIPADAPVLLGSVPGRPERLWGSTGTAASTGRAMAVLQGHWGRSGAMYFLALNTPMTDVTMALERLHVPHLMVELMELIYRFIFVLTETASRIRLAQESRLGYQGLRRSLSSLGTLASMVFLRAWRKADRVYTALESRGYSGSLVTLSGDYARGAWLYPLTAAVAAVQLAAWYFERRVMG